jgi:hypothetical protein
MVKTILRRAANGLAAKGSNFFSWVEAELWVFFEKKSISRFRIASEMLPVCFRFASGQVQLSN